MEREISILIVGATGSGKSKLGDLVKNTIFKLDGNSKIVTNDPDREVKTFGEGGNTYNVEIRKVANLSDTTLIEMDKDVVIILTGNAVNQWFQEVYES